MNVVVGYSPNKYGRAALDTGVRESKRRGGTLYVVNATKGEAWVDPRFASDNDISELEKELSYTGVSYEVRHTVGVDVGDQILEVVEVGAGLLVIGMRRRSPVGKLLLGSLAQRLLMDCPVPILAVKPV